MKLNNFPFLVALLYCAVAMPIDETVVDISDADFTEADFVEYYHVITASETFLSFVTFPLTTHTPPSAVFSNSTFRTTLTTLIKSCRSVLMPSSHRAECAPRQPIPRSCSPVQMLTARQIKQDCSIGEQGWYPTSVTLAKKLQSEPGYHFVKKADCKNIAKAHAQTPSAGGYVCYSMRARVCSMICARYQACKEHAVPNANRRERIA